MKLIETNSLSLCFWLVLFRDNNQLKQIEKFTWNFPTSIPALFRWESLPPRGGGKTWTRTLMQRPNFASFWKISATLLICYFNFYTNQQPGLRIVSVGLGWPCRCSWRIHGQRTQFASSCHIRVKGGRCRQAWNNFETGLRPLGSNPQTSILRRIEDRNRNDLYPLLFRHTCKPGWKRKGYYMLIYKLVTYLLYFFKNPLLISVSSLNLPVHFEDLPCPSSSVSFFLCSPPNLYSQLFVSLCQSMLLYYFTVFDIQ